MYTNDFEGKSPVLKPGCLIAPNAVVVGDVTIEEGASLWYGVTVRGDENYIKIVRAMNKKEAEDILKAL